MIDEGKEQTCMMALRIAAAVYVQDAEKCKAYPRIAEQFMQQAREAGELADLMESRGIEEALS